MKTKFIFITGGVVSSIGKGLAAASLGALLEARGLRVTMQKLDPYINVDPGTMSPFQHGEVFVTDDGAETDLDLGHYERYTNARLSKKSNFTTGQVYFSVIEKERRGDYLGGTVQVIPHITDEIKSKVIENAKGADVAIIEVGGTVGDIESLPFLEAIRQFRYDRGHGNTLYIHVTLVPYIHTAGEMKTKPTQHSVMELRKIGIQPDILLCRCDRELPQEMKKKIALFCNVEEKDVIQVVDSEHIYAVPQALSKERLDEQVVDKLNIWTKAPDLTPWQNVVETLRHPGHGEVRIAVAGKYVNLTESYKSLAEALTHGGIANDCRVYLKYVDSEKIERDGIGGHLDDVDGILVPGGFGERGTEGKITAIQFARTAKIPFFGICLGMQMAAIEFSRNVCGIEDACSSEFTECGSPLIHLMEEQKSVNKKGGTMRLGAYPCSVAKGTLAYAAYNATEISERHRHRYEFNNKFRSTLTEKGMILSGVYKDKDLVEIIELPEHPWFLGCQFHPEFKSKPLQPHPLFRAFIGAALLHRNGR
ncbi:MAG: CTP synthase [Oryzomonas sp.]|uniref:CTP synthase n=1 Tax=Oryzomonas sp. TaxID=2855186 RepID=UPI00284EF5C7|nr:CTP synthase [Oryzomonas sp.]MDR3579673.1 CTP synthase [Oryzomonas sp.]